MIKNIIFDFGGVIYDIDHQKTRKAFEGLGLPDFEKLYGHVVQTRLFEDLEVGAISADNFRSAIRVYLPKSSLLSTRCLPIGSLPSPNKP